VFIAPQFDVKFDGSLKDGGSCPDYLAIDFKRPEIVVGRVYSWGFPSG